MRNYVKVVSKPGSTVLFFDDSSQGECDAVMADAMSLVACATVGARVSIYKRAARLPSLPQIVGNFEPNPPGLLESLEGP